jgi:hypothetical protein
MHDTGSEPILIAKTGPERATEGLARVEREPSIRESNCKQQERNCGSAQFRIRVIFLAPRRTIRTPAANHAVVTSRTDVKQMHETDKCCALAETPLVRLRRMPIVYIRQAVNPMRS